jgi:heme O synthase-like polyprenyltransferase
MSTAIEPLELARTGALTVARDYAELTKLRLTTLVLMTACCGCHFRRAGVGGLFAFLGSVSRSSGDRFGFERNCGP